MRLFDPSTVREFLELPPNPAEDEALRRGEFSRQTDWLETARQWAAEHYPQASNLDHCSFAALVESFTTGLYGGYGTESYPKEEQIQDIILAFAGGRPASAGGIVALSPLINAEGRALLPLPEAEWTRLALELMTIAYFERDPRRALDHAAALVNRIPGAPGTLALVREGLLRVVEKHFRPRAEQRLAGRG